MPRKTYVFRDGEVYEKGTEPGASAQVSSQAPTILPDLPDFVSPIDQTVVRGRAGMRDHCARHNVVPTADLAGLPPARSYTEYKPDRAAVKDAINRAIQMKGHRYD